MYMGFPGGSGVENPPATQDTHAGDTCPIPRSKISPGKEMATHSSIHARTEEPGGLHGVAKESDVTEQLNNNKYIMNFTIFAIFKWTGLSWWSSS